MLLFGMAFPSIARLSTESVQDVELRTENPLN
jgi:hypothetical protein